MIVFVFDGVTNYATASGLTLSVRQGFEKRTNGNCNIVLELYLYLMKFIPMRLTLGQLSQSYKDLKSEPMGIGRDGSFAWKFSEEENSWILQGCMIAIIA